MVYPRVGGGNLSFARPLPGGGGLSPRGRGKRQIGAGVGDIGRSIPAWAEETIKASGQRSAARGLSPRGRGKLPWPISPQGARRSIPAWAGETPPAAGGQFGKGVYPRVGGGNVPMEEHSRYRQGLSPRGRGKLRSDCGRPGFAGSIPAWAGETGDPNGLACAAGVYPRVGGGNRFESSRARLPRGLSPRGRGKLGCPLPFGRTDWSIPAWAGETQPELLRLYPLEVYPRVGGGNSAQHYGKAGV